jgi:ankyrin repeat protein
MTDKKQPLTELARAVVRNSVNEAGILLRRGGNANEVDVEGFDLLNIAAARGHVEMARLLLDHGARINARNGSGTTPLIKAVNMDKTEMVQLLASRGADVNAPGAVGFTPLILCVCRDNLKAAQILLDHGADMNLRENRGYAAQDLAEAWNKKEMLQLLREYLPRKRHDDATKKQQRLKDIASKFGITRRPRL